MASQSAAAAGKSLTLLGGVQGLCRFSAGDASAGEKKGRKEGSKQGRKEGKKGIKIVLWSYYDHLKLIGLRQCSLSKEWRLIKDLKCVLLTVFAQLRCLFAEDKYLK